MSNKVFDTLRTLGWLVPMLSDFYLVVAAQLGLPLAVEVAAIATAFSLLCNSIVEKKRADYNKQNE